MNTNLIDRIARAVLYEGYILYPYRPSLKNQQRWTFGGLFPRAYSEANRGSDAWTVQTQCLVVDNARTTLELRVRCLHLMERTVGEIKDPMAEWSDDTEPEYRPVQVLQVGDERFQCWREAVEREVAFDEFPLHALILTPQRRKFAFPGCRKLEPLRRGTGEVIGVLVREQQPVNGTIELSAQRLTDDLIKVTVNVSNQSPLENADRKSRDEAMMHCLSSTHTLLGVHDGEFVSLMDPPENRRQFASECRNVGTWPVLVGEEGRKDTMLSAPIILYDYPQIAEESPGDLFDGTEIDEILSLRILTLTDEEKRQAGGLDVHARSLLERTEALAREQLMSLHGTVRDLRPYQEDNEKGG